MRVVYFGTYQRSYPRNAQVISCLRRAGVEVVERHEAVWEGRRDAWRAGLAATARLAAAEARLRRRVPGRWDAVVVGYPGHLDVGGARRAVPGAPVVLNPLVSLTETLVEDRRRFRQGGTAARLIAALDRRTLRSADVVVADTAEHAAHLAGIAGIDPEQVAVCFVGAEERLFTPGWTAPHEFRCLFVGKLIPLQGLETVVAAAALAPELPFRIVGSGQLEGLLVAAPPNVEWISWVEYEHLPAEYRSASCAIGVLGTSEKAARVIPNKAFQAIACGTPLVTADTPAARELFDDGDSALLVPQGNPRALAAALRRLAADRALLTRLSEGGLRAYRAHASEDVLGRRWRTVVQRASRRA